jgi:hypothetical protein
MADSDSIRIPDLARIQKAIRDMGADRKELSQASYEAGQITADSVKAFMQPYSRTGKLRSTVKASKLAGKVQVVAGNNTTATYAGVVNFGWMKVSSAHVKAPASKKRKTGNPNIKAQRFFQKALRATRQEVLDKYLEGLQKLVNKYERKANG